MFVTLWRESLKVEPGSILWCPVTWQEAVVATWKYRMFCLGIRTYVFTVQMNEHQSKWARGGVSLHRLSKTVWIQTWATSYRWPCLNKMTSRDPFQSQLFTNFLSKKFLFALFIRIIAANVACSVQLIHCQLLYIRHSFHYLLMLLHVVCNSSNMSHWAFMVHRGQKSGIWTV